jgi:hypothetical protein
MANITKKYQAQELRRKGWSISEIAQELAMHKSGSISKWCRNIILTPKQIERLVMKREAGSYKGRMIAVERKRKIRIKEEKFLRNEGLKEIGVISNRDLFIAGIAIYWSEGYTYLDGDQVGFTNSDPKMILLMLKWFEEICNVPKDRLSLSIRINQIHKNRIKDIENYWSELTDIPLLQFNKTVLIKSKAKKVYPNPESYFGTLRIIVRQGTQLRRRINGWIEGLAKGE